MTVALLPFAEQVAVAWLESHTELAAIHGGRVGTNLHKTLPAIRVTRVGGVPPEPWRDEPSLQLECWAADQITAALLTRTLVAALPDLRNVVVTGGRSWAYTITSGPFWSPDDPTLSNNARYILTCQLLITTL